MNIYEEAQLHFGHAHYLHCILFTIVTCKLKYSSDELCVLIYINNMHVR